MNHALTVFTGSIALLGEGGNLFNRQELCSLDEEVGLEESSQNILCSVERETQSKEKHFKQV